MTTTRHETRNGRQYRVTYLDSEPVPEPDNTRLYLRTLPRPEADSETVTGLAAAAAGAGWEPTRYIPIPV